ncbi:uncharacterized protein LOC130818459 [Amaranthus tricolor]|uniref:uncharacterized protein LOC130818459 n=1 Tax=Amaranthus tricolor TaxID=29722 RepID=UPI00258C5EF1|nr:uncharacterized protein LOC130818459 [Amaranthus tricolor]
MVDTYVREIIRLHGVSRTIFQEAFISKLCLRTAFHPATDGQAERTIQTLKDLLRCCILEFSGSWEQNLPLIDLRLVQENIKTAQSRKKIYADNRRRVLQFDEGDKLLHLKPDNNQPEYAEKSEQTSFQQTKRFILVGIFNSSKKMGSYQLGDSTFYSLIDTYANSGKFKSLERDFDRMKCECQFEKALNFYKSVVECWNMMPNVLTFNLMNWISLSSNKLSGVIPSWIGKLSNLAILKLSNNSFYGEIPSEMKQVSNSLPACCKVRVENIYDIALPQYHQAHN